MIGAVMPEAAQDIQDNLELEARVGALLDELTAAQTAAGTLSELVPATVEKTNGTHAPPPAATLPPDAEPAAPNRPSATSPSHISPENGTAVAIAPVPEIMPAAPLASSNPVRKAEPTAVAPQEAGSAPSESSANATVSEGEQDLAAAVTKLIDETAPATGEATPDVPPAAATAESGKIESLDAELAGLADDLIAGEFADEESVLKEAAPTEADVPLASGATDPGPEAPATPAEATAPIPEAPAERPKPPSAPAPRVVPATVPVKETRPSLLLRTAAAISAPVRDRPPYVRGMIAWIALVNAFLALCVWAWVLVFRPAEAPVPSAPAHGEKAAAHEEKSGGHEAQKPAKAEAHTSSAAKKKAPAKPRGTQAKAAGGH